MLAPSSWQPTVAKLLMIFSVTSASVAENLSQHQYLESMIFPPVNQALRCLMSLSGKQHHLQFLNYHRLLRGPKLSKLTEYGEALKNLAAGIKASKSEGISTGLLIESQAYFGVFGDQRAGDLLPAGNLNTTLEGQVNPAFLTYQSRDGAARLFSALGDPTPIFETFAGKETNDETSKQ